MLRNLFLFEQSQCVRDDHEADAEIGGDGHPERSSAEHGEHEHDQLRADGEGDVLTDAGQRAARMAPRAKRSRCVARCVSSILSLGPIR